MMAETEHEMVEMTAAQKKAQRARNIAIAAVLIAFVVILYVGTWAKLGVNVLNRTL